MPVRALAATVALVVITPAAGFVSASGAVLIGVLAGVVPFLAVVYLKSKLGYDDALDTFGVHAVGGTLGALVTGFFANGSVNANLTEANAAAMKGASARAGKIISRRLQSSAAPAASASVSGQANVFTGSPAWFRIVVSSSTAASPVAGASSHARSTLPFQRHAAKAARPTTAR